MPVTALTNSRTQRIVSCVVNLSVCRITDSGQIHTGCEHANLLANPLILLVYIVNTSIHNSRFHLLVFAPVRPAWIGPDTGESSGHGQNAPRRVSYLQSTTDSDKQPPPPNETRLGVFWASAPWLFLHQTALIRINFPLLCLESRILVRGAQRSFETRGGPWAQNLAQNKDFFSLKLPENSMILKKSWGQGRPPSIRSWNPLPHQLRCFFLVHCCVCNSMLCRTICTASFLSSFEEISFCTKCNQLAKTWIPTPMCQSIPLYLCNQAGFKSQAWNFLQGWVN